MVLLLMAVLPLELLLLLLLLVVVVVLLLLLLLLLLVVLVVLLLVVVLLMAELPLELPAGIQSSPRPWSPCRQPGGSLRLCWVWAAFAELPGCGARRWPQAPAHDDGHRQMCVCLPEISHMHLCVCVCAHSCVCEDALPGSGCAYAILAQAGHLQNVRGAAEPLRASALCVQAGPMHASARTRGHMGPTMLPGRSSSPRSSSGWPDD